MRFQLLLVLCSLLLALGHPGWAEAGAAGGTGKVRGPSARVAAVRAKVRRARSQRPVVRPRAAGPRGLQKLAARLAGSLTLRASVRAQTAKTKEALKNGDLTGAAKAVSRVPLRNERGQFVKGSKSLSMRERFALWRSRRSVVKTAIKLAKGRAAHGDLQGTADAQNALKVLGSRGQLGVLGRWRVARTNKKVFRIVRKSASVALRNGDMQNAGNAYVFATSLQPGTRAARRMGTAMVKESFVMAKGYAKAGNSQLTWSVLEMAAAISGESGAKFSEKIARSLVERSLVNSVPVLTKSATQAYRQGDVQQAIALLAEARAVQSQVSVKTGWSVKRQQAKLVEKLGDSLRNFETMQAQQAPAL